MNFRGSLLALGASMAIAGGALGDAVFVGYLFRGPNWPADAQNATQIEGIGEHAAYMQSINGEGIVLAGGPFSSLDSALVILRAESLEAARAVLEKDPFVQKGFFALEVSEWMPAIGTVSLDHAPPVGFGAVGDGRRTLVQEFTIHAPVEAVWKAFTTTEGLQSFIAPLAEADFRVGGTIKTNYNAEGQIGDATTITHHILSFEPGRMYTARVTPPEGFPWPELVGQTWSVVTMTPIGPGATTLRLAACNYGTGAGWDEMAAYFDKGNPWVVEQLRKAIEAPDGAGEGERVMALLGRLVGGEWVHESGAPDGGVFRVRNVITRAADGVGLTSRGWLGGSEGMHEHASTLVHRSPEGVVKFHNVNQSGEIAEGVVTLKNDSAVVWDWNATSLDGESARYTIELEFTGPDAYAMRMWRASDPDRRLIVNAAFTRVDAAPKQFTRLQPATTEGE